ncbi:MAG: HIT domain-containing protein [Nanoarchaeota archaeon]|nr:HIT domain-containing protein [Nanoarchaeota archaeon]
MQEKIKNMSPEELKEFQKQQCIFCHIVSGKVPSKKIYEDNKCIAILDINPANIGHILLLPKEHYMIMPQVPDEIMAHLAIISKQLSNTCLKAFQCQGTNIFVANGLVAGQKAQHFMIHVIPRFDGDDLNFTLPENPLTEAQLKQIRDMLRQKVSALMGFKIEEKTPLPTQTQETANPVEPIINTKDEIDKTIDKIEKGAEETEKILERLSGKKEAETTPEKKKEKANLDDISKLFS